MEEAQKFDEPLPGIIRFQHKLSSELSRPAEAEPTSRLTGGRRSRPEGPIIQIEEDVAVAGLQQDEEALEKKKFLDELYLALELPHRCSKELLVADAASKRKEAAAFKAAAEAKVVNQLPVFVSY